MQRQDPMQSPFVPFSPNPSLQQGTPTATPPLKHTLTASQSSNLRYSSSRKSIYDRHLNRTQRSELSKSSFAFLFGEMVQYAQKRVSGIQDLEKKSATISFYTFTCFPAGLHHLEPGRMSKCTGSVCIISIPTNPKLYTIYTL